jgi:hypothetical protein
MCLWVLSGYMMLGYMSVNRHKNVSTVVESPTQSKPKTINNFPVTFSLIQFFFKKKKKKTP